MYTALPTYCLSRWVCTFCLVSTTVGLPDITLLLPVFRLSFIPPSLLLLLVHSASLVTSQELVQSVSIVQRSGAKTNP